MDRYIPDFFQRQADHIARLRSQLATLRVRYDSGAVSTAVYAVIRELEIELSWAEHRRVRP
jgi:hypothetical protein